MSLKSEVESGDVKPWLDLTMVQRALGIATEVHGSSMRKGGSIPYLSHVWSVAALVLENGGDSVQVAAGLLHDTAEDGSGQAMIDRLAREFPGTDVAELVEHLSDSLVDVSDGARKEDWWVRKVRYITGLPSAGDRVILVSACDKLHNTRSVLSDHRALGTEVWSRFSNRDPAAHVWYYGSLANIFEERAVPAPLTFELGRIIDELSLRLREGETPDLDVRVAAYNLRAGLA